MSNTKLFVVERRSPDNSVVRLGTVRRTSEGYRFLPAVAGRKPSRKAHPTMKNALPKWVGYPDHCETREA